MTKQQLILYTDSIYRNLSVFNNYSYYLVIDYRIKAIAFPPSSLTIL